MWDSLPWSWHQIQSESDWFPQDGLYCSRGLKAAFEACKNIVMTSSMSNTTYTAYRVPPSTVEASRQGKSFLVHLRLIFWCPATTACSSVFSKGVLSFSFGKQPRDMAIAKLFWWLQSLPSLINDRMVPHAWKLDFHWETHVIQKQYCIFAGFLWWISPFC